MEISVDWQRVNELLAWLWPAFAVVFGYVLGTKILRMLIGDDRRDTYSVDAKVDELLHVEYTGAPERPAPKASTGACRYCGQRLAGDKCGNCGAPNA